MDANECEIRKYLIEEVIRKGRIKISYETLNNALDLGLNFLKDYWNSSTKMSGWLDSITNYELENGRPPLSVVVINEKEKIPGVGFFKTMAIHNNDENSWEWLMKDPKYFGGLHQKCIDEWRTNDFYKRNI